MTKEEEQAIIIAARAKQAEYDAIMAPIRAREEARRAAQRAEEDARHAEYRRREKEKHDAQYGSVVGKVVASIDAGLDDDGLRLMFTDGSELSCNYEHGYERGDGCFETVLTEPRE